MTPLCYLAHFSYFFFLPEYFDRFVPIRILDEYCSNPCPFERYPNTNRTLRSTEPPGGYVPSRRCRHPSTLRKTPCTSVNNSTMLRIASRMFSFNLSHSSLIRRDYCHRGNATFSSLGHGTLVNSDNACDDRRINYPSLSTLSLDKPYPGN